MEISEMTREKIIKIQDRHLKVSSYRVESPDKMMYGFIISSEDQETGDYEEIFKSETTLEDDGEEARGKGWNLVDEIRELELGKI